jgi:hypothetical protein
MKKTIPKQSINAAKDRIISQNGHETTSNVLDSAINFNINPFLNMCRSCYIVR